MNTRVGFPVTTQVVTGLLVVQTGLLSWSAWAHSPTLNEPAHLAAGISHWQFGRFELYRVNPPLVRAVAALPVLASGVNTEWSAYNDWPGARSAFSIGRDLVERNGRRIFWLTTVARWACIPFVLFGGVIAFLWARELYGPCAGLVAMACWTFSPSILGHGSLITADVPASALGLAAAYCFWRWLRSPSWSTTLIAGIALGLSALAKFTLLIFYVAWPLLLLIYRPWSRAAGGKQFSRGTARHAGMFAALVIISIYIINLGYCFEGSLSRLGDFEFTSSLLSGNTESGRPGNRFMQSWLESARVPLPRNYVLGLDVQHRDFEDYGKPSYLRGQFKPTGWWYYYLYCMAVKVPLGVWSLAGLVLFRNMVGFLSREPQQGSPALSHFSAQSKANSLRGIAKARPTTHCENICVLLPGVAILVLVSSQTGFSEHFRYALPALPFLFVWISQAAQNSPISRSPTRFGHQRSGRYITRCQLLPPAALLGWVIGSSLWVYPHSLSYFNELVGGPRHGPRHLIHSNVDWGQDLLYLKRWRNRHPEDSPLHLAYFGSVDPRHAGIKYCLPPLAPPDTSRDGRPRLPNELPDGWYAVSVNFVMGYPHRAFDGEGRQQSVRRDALAYWQHFEPVAMAGYSIYIYRIAAAPGQAPPDPLTHEITNAQE